MYIFLCTFCPKLHCDILVLHYTDGMGWRGAVGVEMFCTFCLLRSTDSRLRSYGLLQAQGTQCFRVDVVVMNNAVFIFAEYRGLCYFWRWEPLLRLPLGLRTRSEWYPWPTVPSQFRLYLSKGDSEAVRDWRGTAPFLCSNYRSKRRRSHSFLSRLMRSWYTVCFWRWWQLQILSVVRNIILVCRAVRL